MAKGIYVGVSDIKLICPRSLLMCDKEVIEV